jgi:hypothetical protein
MPFEYEDKEAAGRFFAAIAPPVEQVLGVSGDRISDVVRFDTSVLGSFGLPPILSGVSAEPPLRCPSRRAVARFHRQPRSRSTVTHNGAADRPVVLQ